MLCSTWVPAANAGLTNKPTNQPTEPNRPTNQVKRALFDGGISRANKPAGQSATPGIRAWEDLVRERGVDGVQAAACCLALAASWRVTSKTPPV